MCIVASEAALWTHDSLFGSSRVEIGPKFAGTVNWVGTEQYEPATLVIPTKDADIFCDHAFSFHIFRHPTELSFSVGLAGRAHRIECGARASHDLPRTYQKAVAPRPDSSSSLVPKRRERIAGYNGPFFHQRPGRS